MKERFIAVCCFLFAFVATSCILNPFVDEKSIELINPTSEPVEIKCFSFDDSEPTISTILGHGRRKYKLGSWIRNYDEISIFESGAFFNIASERITISNKSSVVTLKPNCSLVYIKNGTSSTLSFVSFGYNSILYNQDLSTVCSSIGPYETKVLLCRSENIYDTITFNIGNTSYKTKNPCLTPSFGKETAIYIDFYSIEKKW